MSSSSASEPPAGGNMNGCEEASYFDIPEAPVFYPTPEEFKDPWKYLNSIRHIIWQAGICVIQPPHEADGKGWDFDSFDKHIDRRTFNIVTKLQNIHQMQNREGPTVSFARELISWWSERGRPMSLLPEIQGVVVDFRRLKEYMAARGGYEKVEKENLWEAIANDLRYFTPNDNELFRQTVCQSLRGHYLQYLHPFLTGVLPDEAKPPPSQSNTKEAKKNNQIRCTGCPAVLSYPPGSSKIRCPRCTKIIVIQGDTKKIQIRCQTQTCKVLLAVRASASQIKCPKCLVIMQVPPSTEPKSESASSNTSVAPESKPQPRVKEEPVDQKNHGLKRPLEQSQDGNQSQADSEPQQKKTRADEPLWRQVTSRSFAKGHYDAACAAEDERRLAEMNASDQQQPRKRVGGMASRMGGMAARMGGMAARNTFSRAPEEPDLLAKLNKDFGYATGDEYTLNTYKEMADVFEARWSATCKTIYEKEREYWRIVESGDEWVHVQYGSDLDVGKNGSGFPLNVNSKEKEHARRAKFWLSARRRKRKGQVSEYMMKSGWNTNNLAEATFLHHLNESVAGVTRPMIYVGMMFSSFCWHVEDNYLYSVNYLHTGKPKKWYGVPSYGADALEATFRKLLPGLFEMTPNLLHLLVTQLSPRILKEHGVPVYTAIQKMGQFVITCPRSYHAGFNTGFNVAESVNFALEDWLPMCRQAVNDYRFQRSTVLPYEEFVLKASENPDSRKIAEIVKVELLNVIATEQQNLKTIFDKGITQFVNLPDTDLMSCEVCGYDCFLSGVVCPEHKEIIACSQHATVACPCEASKKRLLVRVPLSRLKAALETLEKRISQEDDEEIASHQEAVAEEVEGDRLAVELDPIPVS